MNQNVSNVINDLLKRNRELEEAIEGALLIKDLWLLDGSVIISEEHEGEVQALNAMYAKFKSLVNHNTGDQNAEVHSDSERNRDF